jgi:hypothetical protein
MPELDEYCTEFLEQLPLSKLRGKNKKLVEMILREIPADYSGYIDGNNSLLLLVQLSKSLNKKRKISKKTMQNIDELIISCRDLAFENVRK